MNYKKSPELKAQKLTSHTNNVAIYTGASKGKHTNHMSD